MPIRIALLLASLSGVVTMYDSSHADNPLYCDRGCGLTLTYRDDLNFVAIPVSWYQGGDWACGDELLITFDDGARLFTKALDAGPFGKNCVMQANGECLPIIADIPEFSWSYKGISKGASILNISLTNRILQSAKIGYLLQ